MQEKAKWIWFANRCGIASAEMSEIYHKFGSVNDIYLADYERYIGEGVSERLAERLCDKSLDDAYDIISLCKDLGAGILTYSDSQYPNSLRSLKDPPAVLYYRGRLPDFNKKLCIAMVGTRKMSEYGMRAAYKIAYEVASADAVIVSGMALGIDSVTHCATIAARGQTVAVLGCGIDVIYPKVHARLHDAIIENGAVVTEFPPNTEPKGFHFPIRNRIISGLAQGTVVIDASCDSGSMITAKNAILQGRDVFAVPGNIGTESAKGTNLLIRDGALTALDGGDIIRHYFYIFRNVVDIGRLKEAGKRSSFDAGILASLGVKASGERSVKKERSENITEKRSAEPIKPKEKTSAQATVVSERSRNEVLPERSGGDDSDAVLKSLSEKHRKIFDEMPLDKAIPLDYLVNAGFKLAEVISALTVLEIKGLISSLPGALYIRK